MAKAKARVSDAASDVHAQIRETVQAIDALWTTRVVISLEEEARTQDDHDAKVRVLEERLDALGEQLPAVNPTLQERCRWRWWRGTTLATPRRKAASLTTPTWTWKCKTYGRQG